ncbi:MAG TPA: hypothetical protein DCP11_14085 [Microbacteriaceae bacterium]|jgi:hypothetical protein|nr:hypothetical protein [Microbacteriaceae bacterium]
MGLTQAEEVFGGITETGINDILDEFFHARPRHLRYGSPGFVPTTTVAATSMPAIAFPGVPGGIDWSVRLTVPRVDLFPQTTGLPPELSLGGGQLSVSTAVTLCVSCDQKRGRQPDNPDGRQPGKDDQPPRGRVKGTCFTLKVFGVGHIERTFGPDSVRVIVDSLEIVDIEPNGLESVIECLLLQILRAVLADVRLPLTTLRAGAFSLTITRGPEIGNDELSAFGNL